MVESKKKKQTFMTIADLDRDEYIEEQNEYIEEQNAKSPELLLQRAVRTLKSSTQFHVYVALQLGAAIAGYGQVMLVIGIFWAMLANTGRREEGSMSAYSLFNENAEAIAGSTDMDALERELRGRSV
ncbi:hypothetical protein LTR50_001696 [Elasticomyces elasticus]|nr:hypothetical protein LTR50_001696 [Elasticomyces elasticus]